MNGWEKFDFGAKEGRKDSFLKNPLMNGTQSIFLLLDLIEQVDTTEE